MEPSNYRFRTEEMGEKVVLSKHGSVLYSHSYWIKMITPQGVSEYPSETESRSV